MLKKSKFIEIKNSLLSIMNNICDENLETAKKKIIFYLNSVDCKALNDYIPSIQQATNSEQLKKKLGLIVSLCDLIVKTRYTLC